MAFTDQVTIQLKAGRGGNGVVRWRHEKGKEFMGPAGGDGGNGGNVFVTTVQDIMRLTPYRSIIVLEAEKGSDGQNSSKHGKSGNDLVVEVPVGTLVTNKKTGESWDLTTIGQRVEVLKGGAGGMGNEHFKSSTNTTPLSATDGKEGEEGEFTFELKLIADIGFVGFPNAGKSSLLNTLTKANAKIGSYAFTTLEPNLGVMNGYILADIPGLIEGASSGKGLGHKFLRHISRTRILLHCISLESENPYKDYLSIRDELEKYDALLLEKPELILLTKTDVTDDKSVEKVVKQFSEKGHEVETVTILDDEKVKKLKEKLSTIISSQMQ
ncbi:MAG: GTPase ObgE [Candidatus Paceibacterota bacterium]